MNQSRKLKKMWKVGITAGLVASIGAGGIVYSTRIPMTDMAATQAVVKAEKPSAVKTSTKSGNSSIFKDEAVYAMCDPLGTVHDVTVANWLKNSGINGSLADISNLTDIKNTKGTEKFTQSNDALTWNTENQDIYYQGKSNEELPVGVKFIYKLDGQEIKPEDLAGKSGHLEIQVKYTNNSLTKTTIGGRGAELYTPFVMATAFLLPTDTYTNVSVDNGQLVSDGSKVIVIGYGLPGVQKNLDLDSDTDISIPDTVTVTADVKNFTLGSTLTYASSDLLNDMDLDHISSFDDLKDSMTDLKDASIKLVDGSSDLTDGMKTLKDSCGDLTDGADQLVDGLKDLKKGSGTLESGIKEYTSGVSTLVNGTKSYVNGANTLCDGITTYTNGADSLVSGINQLGKALSTMPDNLQTLSNGYTTMINGIGQLASKKNMDALTSGASGLSTGITSVNTGLKQVQTGISTANTALTKLEASFANNEKCIAALNAMIATMPNGESKKQMQTVVTNLTTVTETQKKTIQTLKASTTSKSTLGNGINQLVTVTGPKGQLKNGADKLKGGLDAFAKGASQIQAGYPALKTGTTTFTNACSALPDAITKLTNGANTLGKNSATLRNGAKELKSNSSTLTNGGAKLIKNNKALNSGINSLDNGAGKLLSGANKLTSGSDDLVDGVNKLYDGSVELSDGMSDFHKDGTMKLYNTVNTDLQNLIDRLRATQDLGSQYNSFSGKSKDMNGNVKFIIKTDEIKNDNSEK